MAPFSYTVRIQIMFKPFFMVFHSAQDREKGVFATQNVLLIEFLKA
jgi:hypothetical protein